MKIRTEQVSDQEEEIVIRYHVMRPGIAEVIEYLEGLSPQIMGRRDQADYLLRPSDIYYFESIENRTFVYQKKDFYQCGLSLAAVEQKLESQGFFRCNKSMVVNIHHIASLKSEIGSRMNATLDNGEHLIISRRYAKQLREILKGGTDR